MFTPFPPMSVRTFAKVTRVLRNQAGEPLFSSAGKGSGAL
jgi:hypothetical protein